MQNAYSVLWDRLTRACRKHGVHSKQACKVRDQMNAMWTNMSAEERKSFYPTWGKEQE